VKKLILSLLLFTFSIGFAAAQNPAIRDFIREHRKGEENMAIKIPGWMIGLASEVGMLASDDEEEELIFSLASEFGTMRLLTFDNNDFNAHQDIKYLLKALETQHEYERWATVRAASGEEVQLTVRLKGDEIREIVAIVSDPEEHRTFFGHFRTHLSADELGEIMEGVLAEN